jgi:predicted RNase H-like HicB family nuclease
MRGGRRYRVQVTSGLSYTAVFEPVEDGWVQARLAELPGVITAAPTQDEAQELLLDALREYLLSLIEPSDACSAPVGGRRIDVELRAS